MSTKDCCQPYMYIYYITTTGQNFPSCHDNGAAKQTL